MAGKLKDRTGEKGINNEGYTMEIVAYRGAKDIDVLIDDKCIRKKCAYSAFKAGQITAFKRGTQKQRVGEKGISNEGYTLEIVDYRGFCDVDILIDGKHIVTGRTYNAFKKGEISNPYHRSVVGIGYYGVGKYRLCKGNEFERKIYGVWRGMLNRCYMLERKSYAECTVDERFHNFQVFAAWYEENFYTVGTERMDIDKDILIKGNKVYSPDACILVPVTINTLFIQNRRHRGALPVGVYKFRNKYRACVSRYDSSIDLGTFDTPEEAFHAYKTAKEAYIKQVADEYKDKIPKKLYDALYAYTIEITD